MRISVGLAAAALIAFGHVVVSPSAFAEASSGPAPAQAMTATLVKEIKRTIAFAPASAQLDANARKILAEAARLIPESATGITVSSVGYVQPNAFRGNDFSLSKKRARAVAADLRRLGVHGTYAVSGRGRAEQSGHGARRAEVVISFTP